MSGVGTLASGLTAFEAREWGRSFASYAEADAVSALAPGDLERWATTAYLTGRDDVCVDLLTRAHHDLVQADPIAAARLAFWIAFNLLNRGELAQAGGWLSRAQRLLDDPDQPDCAVSGYLMMPAAMGLLAAGEAAAAQSYFVEMTRTGERFEDPDLLAFGLLGQGECLIALGEPGKGVACLDEVMVAVTSSRLSVVVTGLVYCAVLEACHEIYDVRRAREWTTALSEWCGGQPDLVPYRGQCLVHRAEILRLHGEWTQASHEVEKARQRFSHPPGQPALGAAMYQMAELHRLRGELPEAEHAYRQAGQCGHETQPGLALLRLAQGREEVARAGVDRALEEAETPRARPHLLAASVEIALSIGDLAAARAAADALTGLETAGDVPMILARPEAAARVPDARRAAAAGQEGRPGAGGGRVDPGAHGGRAGRSPGARRRPGPGRGQRGLVHGGSAKTSAGSRFPCSTTTDGRTRSAALSARARDPTSAGCASSSASPRCWSRAPDRTPSTWSTTS